MKKVNQLKAGALLSYISLFVCNILAIIYTPFMIRMIGQSEYGLYSLSNSIIGYLGVLDCGLGTAITRYSSKYIALEDNNSEKNLIGLFLKVYVFLSIVVIIAGITITLNVNVFFSNTLVSGQINEMKILMMLMTFNLAISLPGSIFPAIIEAYEKFVFIKIMNIIRYVLNPVIMVPILILGYKSISIAVVTTMINLLYILSNVYYCFKKLKLQIKFDKVEKTIIKEISIFCFFLFLDFVVDKVYWSTDQFILGMFKGTEAVAIYAIGSNFNGYYMSFSLAISQVFLPKVTKMVAKGDDTENLNKLFTKVGRLQFIVVSYILGGFIIVGKNFIKCWAGNEYEESYVIALINMVPFTIPLIQSMGLNILQAQNRQQFKVITCAIIAVFNIVISIPLSIKYGGVGCAGATAAALIIGEVIILNIYYQRRIKLNVLKFFKEIFKMSLPVIITIIIMILFKQIIKLQGVVSIVVDGSVYSFLFILSIWKYGMNKYEKNLFYQLLSKFFNRKDYEREEVSR